ncbi:MAG: glycosyltransferase, partial [Burkholderiales bacterium]|nr:glycosyltransferase [Burkholderiales bacterium]
SWDRFYPEGPGQVDGTPVIRFDHPPRGHSGRARVPRRHLLRYRLGALLSRLGVERVAAASGDAARDGQSYLERQGPFCPGLLEHLAQCAGHYDAVVFFTALYYPTASGLPLTPVPTVLVPTLHDERSMYHPVYRAVFTRPDWVLWNCRAERDLAVDLYGPQVAPGSLCGVGIDAPRADAAALAATRSRLKLLGPYFLYVGRITRSKGFDTLARAFRRFARGRDGRVKLVVVGQEFMPSLPRHPDIVYAGFASDAERDSLMAGALATVVTSKHESLSLVTLESLAAGTPVIVNGRSPVLRAHAQDSGAGEAYSLMRPLAGALRRMAERPEAERLALGRAGRAYVAQHYSWTRVQQEWLSALERVTESAGARSAATATPAAGGATG